MSRTGINEVNNITDPLLAHQFDLFITNMPVGDSRALATQVETAQWPGYGNEPVLVRLHGITKPFAGAGVYDHDWSATFLETRSLLVRDSILAWLEYIRSVRNTTGAYNIDYAGIADLVMYDDRNNAIRTTRMFGFYPEKLDMVPLSGEQGSETIKFSVQFKLFYFTDL